MVTDKAIWTRREPDNLWLVQLRDVVNVAAAYSCQCATSHGRSPTVDSCVVCSLSEVNILRTYSVSSEKSSAVADICVFLCTT